MGSKEGLHEFLRTNRDAWQFAAKGTDDYLLARLGTANALWSSFEMGTQSVEKLLKAYLLFVDKGLGGSADAVRKAVSAEARKLGRKFELGHDVEACLALARAAGLGASPDLEKRVDRINEYYARRYPDGGGPASLATKELHDVDEAVFEIWDAFEGLHPDYFFVGGLMRDIYGMLLDEHAGKPTPFLNNASILTGLNRSFDARRGKLEGGIRSRITAWYGGP